jgi:ribosomal protein L21E
MSVLEHPNELQINKFKSGDLVIWYDPHGRQYIPTPGVVMGQESDCILIKVRVEGTMKEVRVSPEELVSR